MKVWRELDPRGARRAQILVIYPMLTKVFAKMIKANQQSGRIAYCPIWGGAGDLLVFGVCLFFSLLSLCRFFQGVEGFVLTLVRQGIVSLLAAGIFQVNVWHSHRCHEAKVIAELSDAPVYFVCELDVFLPVDRYLRMSINFLTKAKATKVSMPSNNNGTGDPLVQTPQQFPYLETDKGLKACLPLQMPAGERSSQTYFCAMKMRTKSRQKQCSYPVVLQCKYSSKTQQACVPWILGRPLMDGMTHKQRGLTY